MRTVMRTPDLRLPLAALAALTAAGCLSHEEGAEEFLEFSHETDDPSASLDQPIAIGAEIELRASDPETGALLPIDRATVEDPGVIAVTAMQDGHVTLRGIGEGTTIVRVSAVRGDESVEDWIQLSAEPVRHVALASGCADEQPLYLARSRIHVPFDLQSAPGRSLIGLGPYPVTLAPEGTISLEPDATSQQYLIVRTGAHPSRGTITSDVDDARIVLDVADEGAITDAALLLGQDDQVAPGVQRFVRVQPIAGERAVCQGAAVIDVVEGSPEICHVEVSRSVLPDAAGIPQAGWLEVTGVSPGTCTFRVRYPFARGGAGLELPFTMTVEVSEPTWLEGEEP